MITNSWQECQDEVEGTRARFQGFDSIAKAQEFLKDDAPAQAQGEEADRFYGIAGPTRSRVATSWHQCHNLLAEAGRTSIQGRSYPRCKRFRTRQAAEEWANRVRDEARRRLRAIT